MLRGLISRTVNLLYPLRCAGCGRFGMVLCPTCLARLTSARGNGRCAFCAAAWDGPANCPRCTRMDELEGVRACYEMTGAARQLIHQLKYHHYRAVAPAIAALMNGLAGSNTLDGYFAVPLHASRLRERGFNQSQLLLANTGWSPIGHGLQRVRKTGHQVGRHLNDRRENVAGAFAYHGPPLDGQVVAIVDDVVTTGATVNECAAVLKDAGARAVWAFAFARTSYHPDTAGPIED